MQFVIDPRSAKPLYVQLMDEVRRLIVTGELAPDAPLPSVRQLAAELRINHNTIVQAYRELERDSVVYVRRGQGTFVTPQQAPQGQRERLLADVVDRALADAHRHGIAREELIDALQQAGPPMSRKAKHG